MKYKKLISFLAFFLAAIGILAHWFIVVNVVIVY